MLNNLLRSLAIASIIAFSFTIFSFSQNDEQITITTYYPSPFGSYDHLGVNKLAVDVLGVAVSSEYSAMQNGDAHIGRSLIVAPANSGYDYNRLNQLRPTAGGMLISGNVRIGVTNPVRAKLIVLSHNFQQAAGDPPDLLSGDIRNTAIRSNSDTGYAVEGYSRDNSGIRGHGVDSEGGRFVVFGGKFVNGINPVVELYRRGNAVNNGMAGSVDFYVENSGGSYTSTGRVAGILTDTRAGRESSDMSFWTRTDNTAAGFSEKMRITSAGNVGIGMINPQVKLDLKTTAGTNDGVRLGYVSEGFCNSNAQAGTLRYNTNKNVLEYCDGVQWTSLGGVSAPAPCRYTGTDSKKYTKEFSPGFRCAEDDNSNRYRQCEPDGSWKIVNSSNAQSDYYKCTNYCQRKVP